MPRCSLVPTSRRTLAAAALVVVSLVALALPRAAHAGTAGYLHPLAPATSGHVIWDPDLHQFWVTDPNASGVWSYSPAAAVKWRWHGIGEYARTGAPYEGGSNVFLDRARQRLVLPTRTRLHSLSTGPHATWQSTPTVGSPPAWQSAAYDEAGDRMICAGEGGVLWQLTLSDPPTWSDMGVTTPLADFAGDAAMAIDPVHHLVVAAGGSYFQPLCPGYVTSTKAWRLPLSTMAWSALPDIPWASMWGSRLHWDAARQRVLATGGQYAFDCGGSTFTGGSPRAYVLDPVAASPAWTLLTTLPDLRTSAATAIDPDADALVAFAGHTAAMGLVNAGEDHQDVQVMPLSGPTAGVWSQASTETPRSASGADMTLDPTRGELIVHGGALTSSEYGDVASTGSVTRFDDPDSLWTSLAWAHDATGAASVVDPVHDQLVLFGGCYQSAIPVSPCEFLSTTTVVSLASGAVTAPVTGPTPPVRKGAVMVWDASLGRAVLFGGRDELDASFLDTWALDPSTWTWSSVPTTGAPPPGDPLAAVYDPAGARTLVLSNGGAGAQLHSLGSGTSAWEELPMTGTVPALQSIALDTYRARLLGADDRLGVYEAPLGTPPIAWSALHAPQASAVPASAFYDAIDDRLLLGMRPGTLGSSKLNVLAVDFGATALDVAPGAARLQPALRIAGPQPSPKGPDVEFTLAPGEGPARLELYDVLGRRLWAREVGAFGAGRHRVRAGGEAWLPAGVYVVRLVRAGGRSASARAIVVR